MNNNNMLKVIFCLVIGILLNACTENNNDDSSAAKGQCSQSSASNLQTVIFQRTVGNQSDLYMAKEDCSSPIALANSVDEERFQAITPSGRLIYWRYVNDTQGELYSTDKNGRNPIPLTDNLGLNGIKSFRAITPSGKIIFDNKPSSFSYDLYMMNDDATGLSTISASSYDDTFLGFTRNGWIMFDKYHWDQNPYYIVEDIYVANEETNVQYTIANSGNVELYVNETNDGRIIYDSWPSGYSVTNGDVFSVNLDGSDRQILANSSSNEFCRAVAVTNAAGVATSWAIIEKETGPGNWDLISVKASGTTVNADGTIDGLVTLVDTVTRDLFIAATSSGRVIYSSDPSYDLFSINADGTDPQPLANSADNEVSQAFTSKEQVIYRRSYGNTQSDLHIVNADGSANVRLTESADKNEEFVHEAADGRIIFSTLSTTYPSVYGFSSINPDGTGVASLVADTSNAVFFISETPSGRLVFVESSGDGYFKMFSIDSFGNGLANLADKVDRFSYKAETASGRIIFERRDEMNTNLYNVYSVKADGSDLRPIATSADDERFVAIF